MNYSSIVKTIIYYLEYSLYVYTRLPSSFIGHRIMKHPIRRTELLSEVRSSNNHYYSSMPNTSLRKALKLRDLRVASVECLTNEQIKNLENRNDFGKRYIPKESLDFILQCDDSFSIHELSEYTGVIPERVLDSIKVELHGVFSVYERIDGKYVISDENIDRTQYSIQKMVGSRSGFANNSPDKYKFQRKDYILVKKDKVGFEDFKNNKDVNKCEQALYLTELKGGYRIVESW